jgi:hypothetical protein
LYPIGQPQGWLEVSLSPTTAPATLTLKPTAANLQPGTYTATVTLRSSVSGVADKSVNVTLVVTAQAPSATTLAATNIAITTATVSGRVNPNGTATQAFFEVSTDSTFGSGVRVSDPQTVGSGTSDQTVNLALTQLTAATRYFFRVVATNSAGTTRGGTLSFTTLPVAAVAPPPPSNLRVATETTGQRRANLTWDAPTGVTVTSYRIERRIGNGEFATLTNVPGSTTSYTDSTVQNNTTYTYRVRSCAGTGSAEICSSDPSNAVTVNF